MNGTHALLSAALVAAAASAVGCGGESSAGVASVERDSPTPAAVQTAAAGPPSSTVAAPEAPLPRDAAGIRETTFDDVRFPMVKTQTFVEAMLTDRVRSLFGQRIRIRGYMYPTPRKRGLKQFVLVRDNMECCFGPGAALFDCVLVSMKDGATAEYSIRPVAVEGQFRFDPLQGPEGRPLAIYQLECEAVK